MRIGKLGIRLFNGKFVLEDFVIDGLAATDRPFLNAKRIDVSLTWDALLRREVLLDSIEMSDWHMVIEQWPGGLHSFPKFNTGGGAAPFRDDDAVRADAERGSDVRRSRNTMERGRPESRDHRDQGRHLSRRGDVPWRDHQNPELPADERIDESAVSRRRRHRSL